jgi:hypothetical protein
VHKKTEGDASAETINVWICCLQSELTDNLTFVLKSSLTLFSKQQIELFMGDLMKTGIKPRVNEAREFLEIAKDFKDPREILREAISNSWDANASRVSLKFDLASVPNSRSKKIVVRIEDDGDGMSSEPRPDGAPSEIEGFFNLGDSYKGPNQIGSKGHGTKIFYKSSGILVETCKNGRIIKASTEVDPWQSLKAGKVPTYCIDESEGDGKGTLIKVDGFEAKHKEFSELTELINYIKWYTVAGSFGHYFDSSRKFAIELKPIGQMPVTIPYGFSFPDAQEDFSQGTETVCKIFGPEELDCGVTSEGRAVKVQIVAALLGEDQRSFVPDTYSNMGLWLAKDFIRIERQNSILEKAFGGQYYYRNFMILANSQEFDLTANRNNIRSSDEEYDLAEVKIAEWCQNLSKADFVTSYFAAKSSEEEEKKKQKEKKEAEEKEKRTLAAREDRVNRYKGRAEIQGSVPPFGPKKVPINEAETALLLQAMICAEHPHIDFRIGDYNTTRGVDMLVERSSKAIDSLWWVEVVHSLAKLNEWSHSPEGYHAIVCYELGGVGEKFPIANDRTAVLLKKDAPGRYAMTAGDETFEIYVLGEMLK